jgi:hypothetical protein
MKGRSLWKYVPPAGPVLSLLLIGLVLLSALLYYRAVKIQRFLEPALALSQPRNEFSKSLKLMFQKEYGAESIKGLKVRATSILIEKSFLFEAGGTLKASAQVNLQKLARVFLLLMDDDQTRSDVSLVLIIARFPTGGTWPTYVTERIKAQRMVGFIQDALFFAEPRLGIRYGTYFVAAAQPANLNERDRELIELRIIPSELLHIKVLEKLEKYAF